MNFLIGFYNGINILRGMLSLEFIGFMIGLLSPLFILGIIIYFVFMRD